MLSPSVWVSGLRALRRERATTILAIVALGLGIAAPTTVFSIIHGITRDLPFPRAEDLVHVTRTAAVGTRDEVGTPAADIARIREGQRSFAELAAYQIASVTIGRPDVPTERHPGAFITANAFRALGVPPRIGAAFQSSDEVTGAGVVIIGHDLWQRRFGGSSAILGTTVRVNGQPAEVIGVMPPDFAFPLRQEVWLPLRATDGGATERRVQLFGRLAPGVSLDAAGDELAATMARLAPATAGDSIVTRVIPYKATQIEPSDYVLFAAMLTAVSFVLLVACANVATLMLVRVSKRTTAIAVKTAMGAPRGALAQEILAEVGPIAVLGGLLGLWLSSQAIDAFNASIGDTIPAFWMAVRLDPVVALFAAGAAIAGALIAGIAPAIRAASVDPANALRAQGRGAIQQRTGRVMRVFVVAELGLSTLALIAAALMAKGVLIESRSRLRFDPTGILTTRIDATTLPETAGRSIVAEVVRRLEQDPAVASAAATDVVPGLRPPRRAFSVVGRSYPRDADLPTAGVAVGGAELFDLLSMPPVQGRMFTEGDDATRGRVAVVSESFAARHFPVAQALGAQVRLAGWSPDSVATIVGIVPDLGSITLVPGASEVIWLPPAQHPPLAASALVRGRGGADEVASAIRGAIAGAHQDLAQQPISTLERDLREARRAGRTLASVFAASGVAGLLLAILGVYGVVAARVRERTRELAIRGALGASPIRLMLAVLSAGMRDLLVALVLGVAVAAAFTPTLEGILFGVDPHDADVFGAVILTLVVTTLAAVARPALTAARIPPGAALNE